MKYFIFALLASVFLTVGAILVVAEQDPNHMPSFVTCDLEATRSEALAAEMESTWLRYLQRHDALDDLLHERRTLDEVRNLFMELNQQSPLLVDGMHATMPNWTDAQIANRQLFDFLRFHHSTTETEARVHRQVMISLWNALPAEYRAGKQSP